MPTEEFGNFPGHNKQGQIPETETEICNDDGKHIHRHYCCWVLLKYHDYHLNESHKDIQHDSFSHVQEDIRSIHIYVWTYVIVSLLKTMFAIVLLFLNLTFDEQLKTKTLRFVVTIPKA